MGKKSGGNSKFWTNVGIIIIPASLFWILYRYGFDLIIDALAVGVLAAGALLFGVRFLFTRKIISFRK